MEQRQRWPNKVRYIITEETPIGSASVQLELWDEPQDWDGFKGTAFIWGLWVDEPIRRKGYATRLMDRAEQIAKENGHDAVFIEWFIKESPIEISYWYDRRGYDEKAFTPGINALMRKELK